MKSFYTIIFSLLFVFSLIAQDPTVGVEIDVAPPSAGTQLITIMYCANGGNFESDNNSDEWTGQVISLGWIPATGIVGSGGVPSGQITSFTSNDLPFEGNFNSPGIIAFDLAEIGGTSDGNIYTSFVTSNTQDGISISDGECVNVFSFEIPASTSTASNSVFLKEDNTGSGSFQLGADIKNSAFADNLWDGTSSSSALPIILNRFTATKGENIVNLDWSTSSEINGSHFDVQRSRDLSNWATIGTVDAVGESSTLQDYQLVDNNLPLNTRSSKTFYYRLNMVDNDGSAELSEVRTVRFDQDGADFIVYPNPSFNEVFVSLSTITTESGPATMNVINMKGERVKEVTLSTNDDVSVDISNITAGVYYFVVVQGQETFLQKVIKID